MEKLEIEKIHGDGEVPSLVSRSAVCASFIFYGSNHEVSYSSALKFATDSEISAFDIIEIEPEVSDGNSKGEIKIKMVRELIRQLNLTPGHGKFKLAIIKDADKLNAEAANTLLKTLEEPPASAKIILLSSNLKLLGTIRSRCQVVRVEDKEGEDQNELLSKFETAISSKLKDAFKSAGEIADSRSLEQDFDSLITMLRKKMLQSGESYLSEMIKLLIEAKKNFKMTTSKRLVIENLFLGLKNVKNLN